MIYLSLMLPVASIHAFLLSLILLVTGQGMAFARGQAPAEGQMVLCTGQGMVMVHTDADGRPTSAPQLCSDGAQALLGLSLGAPVVALHPSAYDVIAFVEPVGGEHVHLPRLSARDPPKV